MTVWLQLPKFRGDASVGTWIFRIASNKCLRQIEKQNKMPKSDMPKDIADTPPAQEDDKTKLLYKCISELPETDRIIISLELEDVDQKEIADIVGISENSVKNLNIMNDNIDFKELWQQQETTAPDVHKLIRKAKRFKLRNVIMFMLMNILMISAFIFLVFVARPFEYSLVARVGAFLILISMLLPVITSTPLISSLAKIDADTDTNTHLGHLINYKEKLSFFQTKVLNIVFILLSIGFLLFFVDAVHTTANIIAFVLTFLWIGFNWFYMRPRIIRKRQGEVDDLISKFKVIKQQLESE